MRLTPEERRWNGTIGELLSQMRREKGLSREEAAAAARMDPERLTELESGEFDPPEL